MMRNNRNYFGVMMVEQGDADTMLSGINAHYPETIRPALEVIGKLDHLSKVHGMYMLVTKKDVVFCADTTVAIEPTAEELAETAILTAQYARHFDIEPRVAMLSFSNFGSAEHPADHQGQARYRHGQAARPGPDRRGRDPGQRGPRPGTGRAVSTPSPSSRGTPTASSSPICSRATSATRLLHKLGGAETVGPILMGMKKPVHVLQRGDDVAEIVNMAAVAVVDVQEAEGK